MISHRPTQTKEKVSLTPNRKDETQYPVLCAWCEVQGKRTILNYIEVPGSHGICEEHRRELLKEAVRLASQGLKRERIPRSHRPPGNEHRNFEPRRRVN
jgi:hypothetical protein